MVGARWWARDKVKEEETVPRWRLEEAQGAMRALKNDHAKVKRAYKKLTRFYESCIADLKSKVTPSGCEGDKLSEANREIERLKEELATFHELHDVEEDGAGGKRKRQRKKSSESEEGGKVARLPTEVWTMVAAKLDEDDVLAFALTSKQHRQAQQQAGRKLVTRPCYETDEKHICEEFSRDWCAWWSRRFNISETNEKCMNRVIRVAAAEGYLDVLKTYWSDIPEDKIPLLMDKWTCVWAVSYGHLETLQWLRSQGCLWDEDTCQLAAKMGHLECLQWARQNGCPWNADIMCDDAAKHGHLAVLKWVREQGCPWDEATTLNAAMNGHLKCFKWLMYQGCPWNREDCLSLGNTEFKEWMQEQENLE